MEFNYRNVFEVGVCNKRPLSLHVQYQFQSVCVRGRPPPLFLCTFWEVFWSHGELLLAGKLGKTTIFPLWPWLQIVTVRSAVPFSHLPASTFDQERKKSPGFGLQSFFSSYGFPLGSNISPCCSGVCVHIACGGLQFLVSKETAVFVLILDVV